MLANSIGALLITGAMTSIISKYLDYFICGQVDSCTPKLIGCIPCSQNFNSGVFTLKTPYQVLWITSVIVFFLIFFGFYSLTKKRFKF